MNQIKQFGYWICNDPRYVAGRAHVDVNRIDAVRLAGFIAIHAGCLLVFFVGVSAAAVVFAISMYLLRMFFITAFYHRYFSHRTYSVSRVTQFLIAFLGCTSGQRGPLWWAGHHRLHHGHSDTETDPHSPRHKGFWHSHAVWFLTHEYFAVIEKRVKDWLRFPELRLLEKIDWIPFFSYGLFCYGTGNLVATLWPHFESDGEQFFVWGFFISTVVLYHATYTVNSMAHKFGKQRFETGDDSRNNFWLSLITLGEGWHNNHHRYPAAVQQGFYWWEVDPTYWMLRLMEFLGLISDMKTVPARVLDEGRVARRGVR